jgi:hypothetical protein
MIGQANTGAGAGATLATFFLAAFFAIFYFTSFFFMATSVNIVSDAAAPGARPSGAEAAGIAEAAAMEPAVASATSKRAILSSLGFSTRRRMFLRDKNIYRCCPNTP